MWRITDWGQSGFPKDFPYEVRGNTESYGWGGSEVMWLPMDFEGNYTQSDDDSCCEHFPALFGDNVDEAIDLAKKIYAEKNIQTRVADGHKIEFTTPKKKKRKDTDEEPYDCQNYGDLHFQMAKKLQLKKFSIDIKYGHERKIHFDKLETKPTKLPSIFTSVMWENVPHSVLEVEITGLGDVRWLRDELWKWMGG